MPKSQKTILILGAGGFIGSHLVEHLLKCSAYRVLGLDVTAEKLEGIGGDNFTFYERDLRTAWDLVGALVAKVDVVLDLIAYANPSMYVSSPLEVFDLNFLQNLEVAKLCVKHDVRLIQYSSAEVYGKNTEGSAYTEDATDLVYGPIDKQRWIYATGKALLERVLYAYGLEGGLNYTIVRPFNFIGSRIDYLVPANAVGGPRVFPHFMSALLTGGPLRLVDGGRVHRSFTHIEDANLAFQILLEHPKARNAIFNIGNPMNNITIRGFAELMVELYEELTGLPATSKLVEIGGEEFYGPGYEDGDRLPPDIGRLRALGWVPRHGLRKTLRDAMQYYLDRASESRVDSSVNAEATARRVG
jgi:UDP-apiose/xylose synthase